MMNHAPSPQGITRLAVAGFLALAALLEPPVIPRNGRLLLRDLLAPSIAPFFPVLPYLVARRLSVAPRLPITRAVAVAPIFWMRFPDPEIPGAVEIRDLRM